jgi:hypothetical protein
MSTLKSSSDGGITPGRLYGAWPEERFVDMAAACLRHADLQQYLDGLARRFPDEISLEEAGRSFLGRPIRMLKLGSGPNNILLWSQMHGDEPSATPALLDLADYLLRHADEPSVRSILQEFTLLMIPMLNPDGAEVYQRRNAQGIDINRDALHLATPEGRLLKRVRDEYEPMLAFTLHDQDRRKAVGKTEHVANIALLSVSGDEWQTLTLGRLRTKRACAAIVEALTPFIAGGMSRYDEEWSPRCFGDNITAWGTPVILIESGGRPRDRDVTELTRLNFVAIFTVLQGLARDDLAGYDPQVYDDLPPNREEAWSDVAVRGSYVLQPGAGRAFRADLAFDVLQSDRQAAGCCDDPVAPSQIVLVGDALTHGAGHDIEAFGNVLLPAFRIGVRGWTQKDWLTRRNLLQLARLGVGAICWEVDDINRADALAHAGKNRGPGLPRIDVQSSPDGLPAVLLAGPPSAPDAALSLAAVLQALGVEGSGSAAALETLWSRMPDDKPETPPLAKDKPASFLMVSAGSDGQIDFLASRLVAVWLDGQQVANTTQ